MIQEHMRNCSRGISPNIYPGFYLDMVVTPIYDVVAASLKKNCDTEHKKTYDDFNEFFWSPACLKFKTYDSAEDYEAGVVQGGESDRSSEDIHVANGMQNATKTYLEKRSWLHPLLSIHRYKILFSDLWNKLNFQFNSFAIDSL